MVVGSLDWWW